MSSIDPYKLQTAFTPDFERETGKAWGKVGKESLDMRWFVCVVFFLACQEQEHFDDLQANALSNLRALEGF